ncbi:MAG: hypothetical protein ACPHCN_09360 [Mycobacterium sp.]
MNRPTRNMTRPTVLGVVGGSSSLIASVDFTSWPADDYAVGTHEAEGVGFTVAGDGISIGGGAGIAPDGATPVTVNIDTSTIFALGLDDNPSLRLVVDIDQGGTSTPQISAFLGEDASNRLGVHRMVSAVRSSFFNGGVWAPNLDAGLASSVDVHHIGLQVDGNHGVVRWSTSEQSEPGFGDLETPGGSVWNGQRGTWAGNGFIRFYLDGSAGRVNGFRLYSE